MANGKLDDLCDVPNAVSDTVYISYASGFRKGVDRDLEMFNCG
jgi:hypothetical protein